MNFSPKDTLPEKELKKLLNLLLITIHLDKNIAQKTPHKSNSEVQDDATPICGTGNR